MLSGTAASSMRTSSCFLPTNRMASLAVEPSPTTTRSSSRWSACTIPLQKSGYGSITAMRHLSAIGHLLIGNTELRKEREWAAEPCSPPTASIPSRKFVSLAELAPFCSGSEIENPEPPNNREHYLWTDHEHCESINRCAPKQNKRKSLIKKRKGLNKNRTFGQTTLRSFARTRLDLKSAGC